MPTDDNRSTAGDGGPPAVDRRSLLALLGVTGAGALSGCGGDAVGDGGDGAGPTGTTGRSTTAGGGGTTAAPTGSTATAGSTTEAGEEEGTATAAPTDEVLERTYRIDVRPPVPSVAQYNPFNGTTSWAPGAAMVRLDLLRQSAVDRSWQPELLKEWSYTGNIFTGKFYEDHYWAKTNLEDDSPRNITADDWMGLYEIKNFFRPYPFPFIQKTEKRGEYEFRVYFDDTYRKDYAMRKSLHKESLDNLGYYRPWLEQLRDATSNEEIEELQVDLQTQKVYDPNPFINVPFRVTESTESTWKLTLRDDEDPMPHFTDGINFRNVEFHVTGEPSTTKLAFVNGDLPMGGTDMGGVGVIDEDVPFETENTRMPIPNGPGAYGFNFGSSPTSNVHFRRAFAYMLDRQLHSTRFMETDRTITGMLSAERERNFLSESIVDACSGYGVDEVMTEAATAEMEAGGFERDSEGRWLYQVGDRAGEPMSFDIKCYTWQAAQANNATAFKNELADWGINVSVTTGPQSALWGKFGDGEYEIALGYWGGATPTAAYTNAFYPTAAAAFTIYGFPGEWTGPPVGQPATPPGEATDETVTYNVANMLQRLQLTRIDEQYDDLTDRLAWIYNQCLPHVPIGFEPNVYVMNTEDWNWPLPVDEHPFAWDGPPEQRIWNRGVVTAAE